MYVCIYVQSNFVCQDQHSRLLQMIDYAITNKSSLEKQMVSTISIKAYLSVIICVRNQTCRRCLNFFI